MSNTTLEWITRKDAAALARCSLDTIKATVAGHVLEKRTNAGGAVEVGVADLVRLGRISAGTWLARRRPAVR